MQPSSPFPSPFPSPLFLVKFNPADICGIKLTSLFKFKKGKKSLEQEEWTKRLTEEGYECLEWRTIEDCTNWILNNTDLK